MVKWRCSHQHDPRVGRGAARRAELDLLRLYLDEIGRHRLLTKEDEIHLSQAYQAGLDARRRAAVGRPDPAVPSWRPRSSGASGPAAGRSSPTCAWSSRSPAASRPPACRWRTWSRRATWGCCGRWRCSTGKGWRFDLRHLVDQQAITRGAADRGPPGHPPLPIPTSRWGGCAAPRPACTELCREEPSTGELAAELQPRWRGGAAPGVYARRSPRWTPRSGTAGPPSATCWRTTRPWTGCAGRRGGRPGRAEQVLGALPERERQVLILRFGLDSGTPRT